MVFVVNNHKELINIYCFFKCERNYNSLVH